MIRQPDAETACAYAAAMSSARPAAHLGSVTGGSFGPGRRLVSILATAPFRIQTSYCRQWSRLRTAAFSRRRYSTSGQDIERFSP